MYVGPTQHFGHNILCRNVRKFNKFTASVRTIYAVSKQSYSRNMSCLNAGKFKQRPLVADSIRVVLNRLPGSLTSSSAFFRFRSVPVLSHQPTVGLSLSK